MPFELVAGIVLIAVLVVACVLLWRGGAIGGGGRARPRDVDVFLEPPASRDAHWATWMRREARA